MCNKIQVVLGYILGIPTIPDMYPTFPGIPTTVYVFSNLTSLKNHVTKLMERTVLDVKATKEKVTRRYCRSQHVELERGVRWYFKMAATTLQWLDLFRTCKWSKVSLVPRLSPHPDKIYVYIFFHQGEGKAWVTGEPGNEARQKLCSYITLSSKNVAMTKMLLFYLHKWTVGMYRMLLRFG